MKIGIDTFACDSGESALGVYLMQFLKRIPPSGENFELFGWESDRFVYGAAAPDMEYISQCSVSGRAANVLWHLSRYPAFAHLRAWNACFFPAAHRRIPYRSPCPTIGVVHDLGAFHRGKVVRTGLDSAGRKRLSFVRMMILPKALRRLDCIIAVSEWVKQDLMEVARVKESKIEVVPNGIDHSAFYARPRNEESVVLIQPFSFRRPYVLYASRIEHPLKNHIRLIEAFGVFKERTKYPHRLVLAGADSRGAREVHKAAAASPFRKDIFFTGYFPSRSIPELYSGADMVVIPSIYEGFGMGALEAMASGVPVICARAASLPETADHAALYFDPLDIEDMADRMVALTTNRDLYRECRRLGLERARAFSWDRCIKRTMEIILETAGR
jgi:glycosyltransferase involved in cell wall biosynthesis